ncbi:MAG: tRNA (adenosine(37)-N6)-dimethylallyltransferase MiaA [Cytophagaceae bacterium]|nr:tRNA (adenosine(37)-N6)-dimethylallyltransferase MiaA [Cytophagaceae bacterium]
MDSNHKTIPIILGPTASGKTRLAVALAAKIDGQVISVDSRQVYRGMDIGTGKDLKEYVFDGKNIPYHLIDILDAGEKYNLARFQEDYPIAIEKIFRENSRPVICGGTGLYLSSILSEKEYTRVPENIELRNRLGKMTIQQLRFMYLIYNLDLNIDQSTAKRLIRGIEIAEYISKNPDFEFKKNEAKYHFVVFGLNPPVSVRRDNISKRLKDRLENEGLIAEVENLLQNGISHETLQYYGLEYKYISYYLQNKLSFHEMLVKLETEIHRFAKRQMTYFRSMEKNGIHFNWLPAELSTGEMLQIILGKI